MANRQKAKLVKMILDYVSEYDCYSWDNAGNPGIPEYTRWLEEDPEGVKDYFREASEDRVGDKPDPAADAASAILAELKKRSGKKDSPKLRVIVRSEPNYGGGGYHWLAVFPWEPERYGRIQCVPFVIENGKVRTIESFGQMNLTYYHDLTHFVKPMVIESYGVYNALREWYNEDGIELEFRQKLPDLAKTAWKKSLAEARRARQALREEIG